MIQSALKMASDPRAVEFLIYVDFDDETMKKFHHPQAQLIVGQRKGISEMTNVAFSKSSGHILMYAADDIVFRTKGWDTLVQNAAKKTSSPVWLIHGTDLGQPITRIATHGFVSRPFADALGYLLPPYFKADFCDTWLTDVADMAGVRISIASLEIEHVHPIWGKAKTDETYQHRAETQNFWKEFVRYKLLYLRRRSAAKKITP